MTLASSHSVEELERMLADETEALGGMVEDGDKFKQPRKFFSSILTIF